MLHGQLESRKNLQHSQLGFRKHLAHNYACLCRYRIGRSQGKQLVKHKIASLSLMLLFQPCYEFAAIFCALFITAAIILVILLIIDSVLLFASIKRNKVALIVGIVLGAIAILGLIILGIFFSIWKSIIGAILTAVLIAFKLWTLLIVVGALQEVMLEIKPETSMKMSDLQP